MDRRDALKKLGAGGLVVAGASVIGSTPAFAYDQPTVEPGDVPISIVITPTSASTISVTVVGTASCPGSANSVDAAVIATSTRLESIETNGALNYFRVGGSGVFPQMTPLVSFTVAKRLFLFIFGNVAADFVNGDSFSAEISITFRCTYSDGTTATRTITQTRTALRTGGLWSIT
jgi:hypothetical protein